MTMPHVLDAPRIDDDEDAFDLEIRIVESAPTAELRGITDDNCGRTCQSACPNTGC